SLCAKYPRVGFKEILRRRYGASFQTISGLRLSGTEKSACRFNLSGSLPTPLRGCQFFCWEFYLSPESRSPGIVMVKELSRRSGGFSERLSVRARRYTNRESLPPVRLNLNPARISASRQGGISPWRGQPLRPNRTTPA